MKTDLAKIKILIDQIRIVKDEADLEVFFEELKPAAIKKPVRVAFVNAHAFNLCFTNSAFLLNLLECDYLLRDGSGMKILYKLLRREAGLNMNGTDLIPRILDFYKGHDVALFGTEHPYLDRAAEKISEKGLKPILTMNGFHEPHYYVDLLREKKVCLTVLAMGMPKQENVASLLSHEVFGSNLILCGGAILDFIGGKVTRAPDIYQKYGIEWLYRLKQEPKRLFKRYVIGNFVFIGRALRMAYLSQKNISQKLPMPSHDPLKVLHVVRQFAPAIGGLESYVMSMAKHQQALGYDCQVLTLNKVFHGEGGELPANDIIDDIKVRRVVFWGRRRFFIPKVSSAYFNQFDIVHVHNTDVFYDYVALIGLFTKTPCFATSHGGFFHTKDFSLIKNLYFNIITRFSSYGYKSIFATSQNDFNTFKKLNDNIVLQPNAIEPLGKAISQGQDFVYIGRLAQHKNIGKAIEVFSILKQKHNISGNLHIIGPEWDVSLDDLRKDALQFNISQFVQFYGSADRTKMESIATQCGYFISASAFEGFGMSMLEGMSVGMIPLVHNNESFTDLVAQSNVGIATDFNKPEQAAQAIALVLTNSSVTQRETAQIFAQKFSWDKLVENTAKAYSGVLQ